PPPIHTYPLSLHDALPICFGPNVDSQCYSKSRPMLTKVRTHMDLIRFHTAAHYPPRIRIAIKHIQSDDSPEKVHLPMSGPVLVTDRKSTRLNSSHVKISYA